MPSVIVICRVVGISSGNRRWVEAVGTRPQTLGERHGPPPRCRAMDATRGGHRRPPRLLPAEPKWMHGRARGLLPTAGRTAPLVHCVGRSAGWPRGHDAPLRAARVGLPARCTGCPGARIGSLRWGRWASSPRRQPTAAVCISASTPSPVPRWNVGTNHHRERPPGRGGRHWPLWLEWSGTGQ